MITEAIITILYTVITAITGLLPSVDMQANSQFLEENVYVAIKTILEIPLFGTLIEIAIWYIIFEITLFVFHQIASLLRAVV